MSLGIVGCSQISRKPKETTSHLNVGGNRVGQFSGIFSINQKLQTRLLESTQANQNFHAGIYLNPSRQYRVEGLENLLGAFEGEGINQGFRNGNPNAMNMLLWQIIGFGFANDMAASCSNQMVPEYFNNRYKFKIDFAKRFNVMCRWPDPEVKNESTLLDFWLAFISYDAPKAEFDAWRDLFLDPASPFAQVSPDVAISAMVRTMFLNPYFILEH
jgi:hypothetical protein